MPSRSGGRRILAGLLALLGVAAAWSGPAGVVLDLRADRGHYAPGEPITLTLRLTNRGDQPVHLRFVTAQRYDVVVQNAQGSEVWRWSTGQMFAQVLGEETVKPGGSLTYRTRVPGRLAPGHYTATGVVTPADGPISTSVRIAIQ